MKECLLAIKEHNNESTIYLLLEYLKETFVNIRVNATNYGESVKFTIDRIGNENGNFHIGISERVLNNFEYSKHILEQEIIKNWTNRILINKKGGYSEI